MPEALSVPDACYFSLCDLLCFQDLLHGVLFDSETSNLHLIVVHFIVSLCVSKSIKYLKL